MNALEKYIFVDILIKTVLLVLGAVCISMAYQSWEVGIGAASLVLFHRMK
jgi:hypothetical protein